MPKYRFRKMYFICENKRVIKPELQSTVAYQKKEQAETILSQTDKTIKLWDVSNAPKQYSVEGFYLVHESLFEEVLKDWGK